MLPRLILAAASVILLAVGYWLFRGDDPPRDPYEARIAEQASRVEQWTAGDVAGGTTRAEFLPVLRAAGTDCLPARHGVQPVPADSIPAEQRDGLDHAVADLLAAYMRDDPQAVLDSMSRQHERLSPGFTKIVRELLGTDSGVDPAEVAALSDREAWLRFYPISAGPNVWDGVVGDAACLTFWRTDRELSSDVKNNLTRSESEVFENVNKFVHGFLPDRPLEDVLGDEGSVLFADVKVIVRLDPEFYGEPAPYFLRYWYEPRAAVWHPYQMERVWTGPMLMNSGGHLF